jgi:Na+/H+-dicarboxylate symporter
METNILSETLPNKVYKEGAIHIAAFLGGPLVAGYLIAANFKQLGEEEKVQKTWLRTIIGFITYMAVAFLVPESVPGIVFTAITVGVTVLVVQKYQAAKVKAHIEAGGGTYPTKRAVLIG